MHFAVTEEQAARIRPGDVVTTEATYAAPHHLNADGPLLSHRRTRAGDVFEAGAVTRTPGVNLGLPTIGPRPPAPAEVNACAAH